MYRVIGIAGSLREGSLNRALLRAAVKAAPEAMTIESAEIGDFPLYNQDLEGPPRPEPVDRVAQQIRTADGLLLATPEYNYSIPGPLKNAIDWLSRPADTTPLRHKPIALIGASPGRFGSLRGQMALRQSLLFFKCAPMPDELYIPRALELMEDGEFRDEATLGYLRRHLEALADFIDRARLTG